jgi:hypothetical protein
LYVHEYFCTVYPERECLLFVKKVSLLRWTIFGYFWVPIDEQGLEKLTVVPAAATVGFVSKVLMNDIWKLR